jgi:septal ring factor EnvC (AmiA/AmiB activator)
MPRELRMTLALLAALSCAAAALSARPEPQVPAAPAGAADRLAALHREADALMSQERSLLGDLRRLEVERDLRLEEARQLSARADALTAQAAGTTDEIDRYEAAIEAARPVLRQRMVDLYKFGQPGYARLLLGATDFRDMARTTRLVTAMAEIDQRRVRDYTGLAARLSAARKALDDQVSRLEVLQADAKEAADLAAKAVVARATLIRDIDRQRDLNARMAGELEIAARRLQSTIAGPTGATTGPGPAVPPIKPLRSQLEWPVATQGPARRPGQAGETVARNGVEMAVSDGQPVRAVHPGRVLYADLFPSLGQLVIVDHGGLAFSLYGYLGTMAVAKGTDVSAGQVIGASGRSPEGQPALYFELRIDGQPVDPLQWLKAR